MGDFHVPIDYSKLQEVIRNDDEILYSTLCVVQVYKIDLKSKIRVDKYLTHAFLTRLGFAMTSSLAKEEYTLTFLPWIDQAIWKDVGYDNNQLIFTKDNFNFIYEPVPDERFEEPDLFEQRSKSFVNQIQDLKALFSSDNEKYILGPPLSIQQLKTTEKSSYITKEFINDILQISPDFYVPVDYTNLPKIIQDNDKILYSTLCIVRLFKLDLNSQLRKDEYIAHVLLTKYGFAATSSLTTEEYLLNFIPWADKIWDEANFENNQLSFMKSQDTQFKFMYEPVPDTRQESLDVFEQRSKVFTDQLQDIRTLALRNNLDKQFEPPLLISNLKTRGKSPFLTNEFLNQLLRIPQPRCGNCGLEILHGALFCPHCGLEIKGARVEYTRTYQTSLEAQRSAYLASQGRRNNYTFGILGAVLATIGLFIAGIFLGIAGIILGIIGLRKDKTPLVGGISIALGTCSLIGGILAFILLM